MQRNHVAPPAIELLEGRWLLSDVTLWNALGQLVIARQSVVVGAANITVSVNGAPVTSADQIVFSYDVDSSAGMDFRQGGLVDSSGVMRFRHLDGDAPPRGTSPNTDTSREDPFGTSVKLSPGLIQDPGAAAGQFFLGVKVTDMNLITSRAKKGTLILQMHGSPVDAQGNAAPVSVFWDLSIPRPTNSATEVHLNTVATFTGRFTLSAAHAAHAEALRLAMFSSSNNTNATAQFPTGTHDADHAAMTSSRGKYILNMDLTAAARNQLLLPAGSAAHEGIGFGGWMQLNQVTPAPLNGDPPNISMRITIPGSDRVDYRAQAFITQDANTDHNADNLGAWISLTRKRNRIFAGEVLSFTTTTVAADDVAVPTTTFAPATVATAAYTVAYAPVWPFAMGDQASVLDDSAAVLTWGGTA